jgi:hypothetical protein
VLSPSVAPSTDEPAGFDLKFHVAGISTRWAERATVHSGMAMSISVREDIIMGRSSFFVASLAVALSSVGLLCSLNDAAMSQTATGLTTALPGVMVQAPKRVIKPRHHVVARTTGSRSVSGRTSPATQTASASDSVLVKLARLEKATGSCVGGCQTSFKYGNEPWHGCSGTGWPALSPTCRNVGNYKTYNECVEAGLLTGWRNNDVGWYCSSLALR